MVQRVMRLPAVQEATGLSRSTIYEKMSKGIFPKPIKLDPNGRAVVWLETDIAAYQEPALKTAGKAA